MAENAIQVTYEGRLAVVTIANEKKLNALNQQQYYALSEALREIATHDEVFITLLIGKGKYFSAGADVSNIISAADSSADSGATDQRQIWLSGFVAYNLNIAHAFYTHPKILVVALNGPAIGLSAALVSHADFVYAAPHAFILTPFSSLGLVAEGGASRGLVQRLGVSKAKEALLMSKRISCTELVQCGFVNGVIGDGLSYSDEAFGKAVRKEIDDRLGDHLNGESLLGIKRLIQKREIDEMDGANAREVFLGLERFMSGAPQEEFMKIATGKKRHKL